MRIFRICHRIRHFPVIKIKKFLRIRVSHAQKPPEYKKSADFENFLKIQFLPWSSKGQNFFVTLLDRFDFFSKLLLALV